MVKMVMFVPVWLVIIYGPFWATYLKKIIKRYSQALLRSISMDCKCLCKIYVDLVTFCGIAINVSHGGYKWQLKKELAVNGQKSRIFGPGFLLRTPPKAFMLDKQDISFKLCTSSVQHLNCLLEKILKDGGFSDLPKNSCQGYGRIFETMI